MVWLLNRPRNDKRWCLENRVLADARIDGDLVHIKDVRAFEYGEKKHDIRVAYENRTFDVRELTSVDLFVEPFTLSKRLPNLGKAHTFLSFGFGDRYVSVSIEVRRQEGERYSPTKGLLNEYEIIYIVGTERDVVKLRTNHRKNPVHLYPMRQGAPGLAQAMFRSVMERVHQLHDTPEFYHTFLNNCTTNLVEHLNTINPGKVPSSIAFLLPGFAGPLAYSIGLIDTTRSYEDTKAICRINEQALAAADSPEFSQRIRERQHLLRQQDTDDGYAK